MSTSTAPFSSGSEPITEQEQDLTDWLQAFYDRTTISDAMPLQRWSPPQDPDKPRLPYLPALALQIHRHVPPSSEDGGDVPEPHLSEEYLESLPQSELVIANPPIETARPANPERAQLVVTTPFAIGASRGAQVVGCTVFPQSDTDGKEVRPFQATAKIVRPFQATAKIYDPLYYNFNMERGHHARDVIFEAEYDYSNESRAYEHLLRGNQLGAFAPAYYGSWTFTLPISIKGKLQSRSVRLILIERLRGTTIENTRVRNNPKPSMGLDSFHYPEEFRLEVLARALEGLAIQQQTGLDQMDFAGRNVLLVQDEFDPSNPPTETCGGLSLPRVVLIDYNHAKIKSRGGGPYPLPKPENPASVSLRSYLYDGFPGWAPREWEDEELEKEWLVQRFCTDSQSHLYLPIPEQDAKRLGLHRDQVPKCPVSSASAATNLNSDRKPPSPPMIKIGDKPGEFWAFGSLTSLLPANQRDLKAVCAALNTKSPALAARPASRDPKKK